MRRNYLRLAVTVSCALATLSPLAAAAAADDPPPGSITQNSGWSKATVAPGDTSEWYLSLSPDRDVIRNISIVTAFPNALFATAPQPLHGSAFHCQVSYSFHAHAVTWCRSTEALQPGTTYWLNATSLPFPDALQGLSMNFNMLWWNGLNASESTGYTPTIVPGAVAPTVTYTVNGNPPVLQAGGMDQPSISVYATSSDMQTTDTFNVTLSLPNKGPSESITLKEDVQAGQPACAASDGGTVLHCSYTGTQSNWLYDLAVPAEAPSGLRLLTVDVVDTSGEGFGSDPSTREMYLAVNGTGGLTPPDAAAQFSVDTFMPDVQVLAGHPFVAQINLTMNEANVTGPLFFNSYLSNDLTLVGVEGVGRIAGKVSCSPEVREPDTIVRCVVADVPHPVAKDEHLATNFMVVSSFEGPGQGSAHIRSQALWGADGSYGLFEAPQRSRVLPSWPADCGAYELSDGPVALPAPTGWESKVTLFIGNDGPAPYKDVVFALQAPAGAVITQLPDKAPGLTCSFPAAGAGGAVDGGHTSATCTMASKATGLPNANLDFGVAVAPSSSLSAARANLNLRHDGEQPLAIGGGATGVGAFNYTISGCAAFPDADGSDMGTCAHTFALTDVVPVFFSSKV